MTEARSNSELLASATHHMENLERLVSKSPQAKQRAAKESNGAAGQAQSSDEDEVQDWTPLDLEVLAELEPQPPRFIVEDWLPVGYASLLAGHGGVGKSLIALYLAVCIAAGRPFFGVEVTRKRVMYLSCEDRQDILHWRLARICAHLGMSLGSLRGWLEIFDLVGKESVLWERDSKTGETWTVARGRLANALKAHQSEVLIVDGISDTFGGREADRSEVKRYVNALLALVPADSGALLLLGHVAKPTAANAQTNEGYSGTTGWHNAVRARWYLYPETEPSEDGVRPQRTGRLLLELQKSNLGRADQFMSITWDESAQLFVGRPDQTSTFDAKHRDREERRGILLALKACADASPPLVVPAAMTGPRTAYHVLVGHPHIPASLRSGKPAIRRFWRQIEDLRRLHMVEDLSYRRSDNRHVVRQLVLTAEGARQCAD